MATAIRIELMQWQIVRLLAVALAFLPPCHATEQDIYVITGPDGVEVFSNLPRGPVAPPALMTVTATAKGRAPLLATKPDNQSPGAVDFTPGIEVASAGKSFLGED